MELLLVILLALLSYLIGSIPNGLIISYLVKRVDIRQFKSKNIGATNATRLLGKGWGFLVFLLDAFKGGFIMLIVRILHYSGADHINALYYWNIGEHMIHVYPIYGLAAILGHVFPIYIGFKGGKAVATTIGAVLTISPMVGLTAIGLFLFMLILTGYVSFSSIFSVFYMFVASFIYCIFMEKKPYWQTTFSKTYNPENWITYSILLITHLLMFIIVVIRHRKNIVDFLLGRERRIKFVAKFWHNITIRKKYKFFRKIK